MFSEPTPPSARKEDNRFAPLLGNPPANWPIEGGLKVTADSKTSGPLTDESAERVQKQAAAAVASSERHPSITRGFINVWVGFVRVFKCVKKLSPIKGHCCSNQFGLGSPVKKKERKKSHLT